LRTVSRYHKQGDYLSRRMNDAGSGAPLESCYCNIMKVRDLRRVCALVLLLALGLGLSMHGVRAGEMTAQMLSSANGELPLPGGCDGCGGGDDDGMAASACAALCGMPGVLSVLKADMLIPPDLPDASRVAEQVGRTRPPDPYPPRPAILT
jgi:hypothetical protein